jgi:small-conductance mechanosensitive channel
VVLPATIVAAHKAVHYVLRPPDDGLEGSPPAPVLVAMIDRGIRMVLIIAAAFLLARAWRIDFSSMQGDSLSVRLLRGSLDAALIVLAADFGWSIAKALISRRLEGVAADEPGHSAQPHHARLRTLLPIFQNILFAAVLVVTLLMVLSSLGIQIGPLIAGAGVVGVAIGFGAQTLVKDVISGMFYLLDDAFRVGEYIESGNYRGTVESFSLRSVKLRHHRGYLFTVPFGELGAVQNMSRDWVIDKFNITVGYDTDIDKARKLIKKVGLELAADPEFAPHVLEPLKMQGVQKFGDYGIELRMKMKTRPGEQFTMRRKAFVVIKKLFEDNGITIPFPTVHVQEGKSTSGAVQALMAGKQPEAPS